MDSIIKIIFVFVLIIGVIFGVSALQSIFTIDNIKDDVSELKDVRGFTMEIYTGLTDIDNETSEMDIEPSRIYKEYGDIRIVQEGNSANILYGNVTYIINVAQKFYYNVDGLTNIPDYDLTDVFPKGIKLDESSWALSRVLDVTNETFKDERCYAVTYVDGNDEYTTYISKEDGVCIGKREKVNGETTYEYYVIDIENVKESDFSYEALFGKYDRVITSAFERPYVQRENGMKEYIDM